MEMSDKNASWISDGQGCARIGGKLLLSLLHDQALPASFSHAVIAYDKTDEMLEDCPQSDDMWQLKSECQRSMNIDMTRTYFCRFAADAGTAAHSCYAHTLRKLQVLVCTVGMNPFNLAIAVFPPSPSSTIYSTELSYVLLRLTQRHRQLSSAPYMASSFCIWKLYNKSASTIFTVFCFDCSSGTIYNPFYKCKT